MRFRRRRGKRGRFPKPIILGRYPILERFIPVPQRNAEPIYIEPAELEALRLVDLEELTQEDAGRKMGVSRGTVWRLLHSGRSKITKALTEARPIFVSTSNAEKKEE